MYQMDTVWLSLRWPLSWVLRASNAVAVVNSVSGRSKTNVTMKLKSAAPPRSENSRAKATTLSPRTIVRSERRDKRLGKRLQATPKAKPEPPRKYTDWSWIG